MSNELISRLRKEVSATIDDESLVYEAADLLETQAKEIEVFKLEVTNLKTALEALTRCKEVLK